LRMVASYTKLLADRYAEKLDQDAKEFIGFAVDGAKRMHRLIEDLLLYSRVSTRGKEPSLTSSRVALDDALANLDLAIREADAVVEAGTLPAVKADPAQLVQIFQNLVGNAIKFRRPDERPHVRIAVEKDGKAWRFAVQDNGIGIESKFFERIFEVFQRLHGREEVEGTGIGLPVCKRIVERHGGRIWVESEVGKGSTFFFALPAGTEDVHQP